MQNWHGMYSSMHHTSCCDEHTSTCRDCSSIPSCSETESTICFDPHCSEPPCEHEHGNQNHAWRVLSCSCPSTLTAPMPACCPDGISMNPTIAHTSKHNASLSCISPHTCSYDLCVKQESPFCTSTVMDYSSIWSQQPQANPYSNCLSVCDGFLEPTQGCSSLGPSEMDLSYAQQLLDHCCASCAHLNPVPCHDTCLDVPFSILSSTPQPSTPALRSSESSSVAGTACSTPSSSNRYLKSPDLPLIPLESKELCAFGNNRGGNGTNWIDFSGSCRAKGESQGCCCCCNYDQGLACLGHTSNQNHDSKSAHLQVSAGTDHTLSRAGHQHLFPYSNNHDMLSSYGSAEVLPCEWSGCSFQVPTMEEFTSQMQQAHVPDHDTKLLQEYLSTPIPLGSSREKENDTCITTIAPADRELDPSTDTGTDTDTDTDTAAWCDHAVRGQCMLGEEEKALDDMATACFCPPAQDGQRKRHPCGWINCSCSFDTHAELTAHIAQVHVGSGKTEYECGWVGCERAMQGRKFTQKQKVLRHIQTHTGDRPYECPSCHKRFSEASTLTQHMRTHTQERPYKCDFPGCNKTFSVVGSLTIHKRTHTGDRPFKCPYPNCDKQFSESSNLNKHIRVHRGDKPFQCPECLRRFTRPDQLTRHRKVHDKSLSVPRARNIPTPTPPVLMP